VPPIPRLQITERRAAAERRRRRRRRGQLRLAGLILAIVVVVLIVAETTGSSSHPTSAKAAARTHATASAQGHQAAAKAPTDPLTTAAMKRLLAGRDGTVSAAVLDLTTHKEWVLNPNERDQTASIVKANILEALLYQAQEDGTPLADVETATAQEMIEASDNDDATALWNTIGGAPGLDAYDDRIGMADTGAGAGGYWGETVTTAPDQIKLLEQLAVPGGELDSAAVQYQLSLMKEIDPGENWGVTGGVPTRGVTVALKNGWVPLSSDTDWEVNSIGWVHGDAHDYLIALLSAHDPSEDYGIDTLDAMSKLIYDTVGPAPSAGTPTITVTPSG
jgi:hypothetical protein